MLYAKFKGTDEVFTMYYLAIWRNFKAWGYPSFFSRYQQDKTENGIFLDELEEQAWALDNSNLPRGVAGPLPRNKIYLGGLHIPSMDIYCIKIVNYPEEPGYPPMPGPFRCPRHTQSSPTWVEPVLYYLTPKYVDE
jgi:hypothetical protein